MAKIKTSIEEQPKKVSNLLREVNDTLQDVNKTQKEQTKLLKTLSKARENIKKVSKSSKVSSSSDINKSNYNYGQLPLHAEIAGTMIKSQQRQDFGNIAWSAALGIDPAIAQLFSLDKVGKSIGKKIASTKLGKKAHLDKIVDPFNPDSYKKEVTDNEKNSLPGTGKAKKSSYGSALEASTSIPAKLDQIIKLLGGKPKKAEEKKDDEQKKKGLLEFLSEKFGIIGKLIKPLLAMGLIRLLKPAIDGIIKRIMTSLFLGNENLGNFAGGILSDMLPGAVGGYILSKNLFGKPNWSYVVIGGGLSLIAETIARQVTQLSQVFSGEEVQVKTFMGIPATIWEGIIGGAAIGAGASTKGKGFGLKGAAIGAIIGGGISYINALITDSQNQLNQLRNGKDPQSAFGKWGKIIAPAIAGGAIGAKYGLKGALLGMLIGGAFGAISKLIDSILIDSEKNKQGVASIEKNTKRINSTEALTNNEYAVNKKRELLQKTNLTKNEKKQLSTINTGLSRAATRLEDVDDADENKDGIVTQGEYAAWKNRHTLLGMGSMSRSDTYMKELLKQNGGKFTREDMINYQLAKYDNSLQAPMQSSKLPTEYQIQMKKSTETTSNLIDSNTELIEAINGLKTDINNKDMSTQINNIETGEQKSHNNVRGHTPASATLAYTA